MGFLISLGGFFGGFCGVSLFLLSNGSSLLWSLLWGIYWGFLFGLVSKILECIVDRNPILQKLGDYFQSWGAIGTFIGLIVMTSQIGVCLSDGETSAIKEQLAGFSICFLTSLIGVCLAVFSSLLSDFFKLE